MAVRIVSYLYSVRALDAVDRDVSPVKSDAAYLWPSRCALRTLWMVRETSSNLTMIPRDMSHSWILSFRSLALKSLDRSDRRRVARDISASVEATDERRYLTVMFCDLVDSTGIAARLDAEEWRDLVGAYIDAASVAVVEMGGHVAKKLGDGLMSLFGYPVAQENDSERAVRGGPRDPARACRVETQERRLGQARPCRAHRGRVRASCGGCSGRDFGRRPQHRRASAGARLSFNQCQ